MDTECRMATQVTPMCGWLVQCICAAHLRSDQQLLVIENVGRRKMDYNHMLFVYSIGTEVEEDERFDRDTTRP